MHSRIKKAALQGLSELDRLARVMVLEGVLQTQPGELSKRVPQSLKEISINYPTIDPDWFLRKDSGLILTSIKGLRSLTQGLPLNEEDVLMKALAFPRSKKKKENYLYYFGEHHSKEILEGKITPVRIGSIFRRILVQRLLNEKEKNKKELIHSPSSSDERNTLETKVISPNKEGVGVLFSILTDRDNPFARKLFSIIEDIIDEYPFEDIKNEVSSPEVSSFLKAFFKKNPRIEHGSMKTSLLAFLGGNPSPKNQKLFDEIEDLDEDTIAEVGTQSDSDANLRKEAYKLFVKYAIISSPKNPTQDNLTDFRKDPNDFWNRQLQKIGPSVAKELGFDMNVSTGKVKMSRILGPGGRNVISFLKSVVAKDRRIKNLLDDAIESARQEIEMGLQRGKFARKARR